MHTVGLKSFPDHSKVLFSPKFVGMFTGIIETLGLIKEVNISGTNRQFWVESEISGELKIDQSVSHNGVCLTVDELRPGQHRVTAIRETLNKTNLASWEPGTFINLERCLKANDRLDGHFVQGHVDATGTCTSKKELNGSWEFRFRFPADKAALMIEKGSIAVNGISLTCFNVGMDEFTVAIIPYTYGHTNFKQLNETDTVNLEFDVLGKYIQRISSLKQV